MKSSKLFFLIFMIILFVKTAYALDCFPRYVCESWSECEDGIQSRTCTDTACGRRDIIERSFCDKPGCRPNIECGSWGECIYTEKTDSLIQGKVSFGGYRTRVCFDTNDCVDSFIQEGTCEETFELQLSEVVECDSRFLSVADTASQREIAKINLDSWKRNKLDLSFVQGKSYYCPLCYDTVKDGDETGIDCGGSCKECKKDQRFVLISFTILLWILSALFSFLSIKEVILIKKNAKSE